MSEGLLPLNWSVFWYLVLIPSLSLGLHSIRKRSITLPQYTAFIALVGAMGTSVRVTARKAGLKLDFEVDVG